MSDLAPSSGVPVGALPADLEYITEELKIRAEKELFENDHKRVESLKSLRSLLKTETNLRYQDDDLFLLAFLRARKFDAKRAFSLIKGFYSCLGKNGHLYYNGLDYFHRIMEENSCSILPYRDSGSSALAYFRCSSWNPENITVEEHMVCLTLGFLQALLSPSTQIAGFQVIADFKDFSLKHLMVVSPSVLRFFIQILQSTMPIRIRGIHVVYENFLLSHILAIVKRLLSRKMGERIHIHGKNMRSLHRFIPPSVLPEELRGELPPYDNSEWRQRMEKSADYLNHVLSFGYEQYLKKT